MSGERSDAATRRKGAANVPAIRPHGAPLSGPPRPVDPLTKFLTWWRRELLACIPAPVLSALSWMRGRRPTLIAQSVDDRLQLETLGRRRRVAHGPLDALSPRQLIRLRRNVRRKRLDVVLAAPSDRALRQKVTLPLSAEADLNQVLFYELERLTPFRANELYYSFEIRRRRPNAGALDVMLIYAPRAELDRRLWELSSAGLPAKRIDLLMRDGQPRGYNLLRDIVRDRGWDLGPALALAATIALIATCAVWTGVALHRQEAQVEALSDAVFIARRAAFAQERAAAPQALGDDAGALAEAYALKSAAPSATAILHDLSAALPDGTWLQSLRFDDGALQLTGMSDDASGLIAVFEAHARFEEPDFRAPITTDPETGLQRFSLSVARSRPEPVR